MPRTDDLYQLPPDLPVPVDDGACRHLVGAEVPDLPLASTSGRTVSLASVSRESRVVVYAYPRTGKPDQSPPPGWDAIPGARGCTPQSCAFRDHHAELQERGARVFGLSTQDTDYQREVALRLHLPFEILSDADLRLVRALRLPTFEVEGMTLVKRLTLVLSRGKVEKVFYPVFPPDRNAADVVRWLDGSRFVVRDARPADAAGLAVVHVDTWRSTYAGLIAAEHLASLAHAPREARWRTILAEPTFGRTTFTLVAEDAAGRIVGFASGGPEREGDPVHRGELYAVYVLDSAQGHGLGRRLTVEIARRLAGTGHGSLLVWVLAGNPACRFYERLGGVEVGRKRAEIGGQSYEEIGYGWRDATRLGAEGRQM